MNLQFTIKPLTLSEVDFHLNVPVYQRPYCWEKDEIEKLLNDFKDNLQENIYYIGNVITIRNNDNYDLIDGQQRMTTLWILNLYLSKYHSLSIDFCKIHGKSRLNFAIRKETNSYLEDLLKQNTTDNFWVINKYLPSENKNNDPSIFQNQNIAYAFNIIGNWCTEHFKENANEKKEFAQFVFEKVTFQFLTAPQHTDENKLFIQINTNGTQFQHSDILKAELINAISNEDEKLKYAALWDTLALNFFSKNEKITEVQSNNDEEKKDLFELIDEAKEEIYFNQDTKKEIFTDYRYEYIIDFNTLLIHSLFIYCKKYSIESPKSFNTEKLLEIFYQFRVSIDKKANDRNEKAINFLTLLKTIKQTIDNHFIFRDKVDTTLVLIPDEDKSKKVDEEFDDYSNKAIQLDRLTLAQFQRMLYHSNNDNKHFWMGIFLNEYIDNQSNNIDDLEKLENWISLKGRNFNTYYDYFNKNKDNENTALETIPIDTFSFGNISRYWFYKLEYLLWKETKDTDKHIISRTSVEHVLTQKERDNYEKHEIKIDEFGNLVLISVSENSTFSDKNLLNKHDYFKGLTNPPYKMDELYQLLNLKGLVKEILTDEEQQILKSVLEDHKNEMIDKIKSHYKA